MNSARSFPEQRKAYDWVLLDSGIYQIDPNLQLPIDNKVNYVSLQVLVNLENVF